MAVEVFMPKMSDHMETGEIVGWLVKEGDPVEEGQALVEVVTDKATAEIEAPATGILKGIRAGVDKGVEVPVGETIAFIARHDEEVPELSPLGSKRSEPTSATDGTREGGGKQEGGKRALLRVQASPSARRRARELCVDLHDVTGTGPGKLVREADVELYAQGKSPVHGTVVEDEDEWLELSPVERRTGERMLTSTLNAPQFSLTVRADVQKLLWIKDLLAEQVEEVSGERLSLTALLVKLTASALKQHPRANSSYQSGRLRLCRQVHVGVAVGSPQGLIVPVVHRADRKSTVQINREIRQFAAKARDMRFSNEELSGGTFTVSNLGMYGIERFEAIVNPPQCCILAVGSIVKTPVGTEDDRVVLRSVMNLTLAVDHRCMDGLQGAQFLNTVKQMVEAPAIFFAGKGHDAEEV
jgi:pyruvate dehydrogenase E2 component (dihydrolipoamide acetyltransferase)